MVCDTPMSSLKKRNYSISQIVKQCIAVSVQNLNMFFKNFTIVFNDINSDDPEEFESRLEDLKTQKSPRKPQSPPPPPPPTHASPELGTETRSATQPAGPRTWPPKVNRSDAAFSKKYNGKKHMLRE